MNREEAQEYSESLGQVHAGGYRLTIWATNNGVPQALGLTTEEWVHEYLGGYIRMSIPERRKVVAELMAEGMSQRQIADALGVDHRTVGHDSRENSPHAITAIPPNQEKPQQSGENSPHIPPARFVVATNHTLRADGAIRELINVCEELTPDESESIAIGLRSLQTLIDSVLIQLGEQANV